MTRSPLLLAVGDIGVIDMALLSVIRRWALRGHLSIQEIARRPKLSRKQQGKSKELHDDLVMLRYSGPYGWRNAFAGLMGRSAK